MIVVGQSGSGKSNLAMSQIIRRLGAGHEIHVIDTKDELCPIFGRHVRSCSDATFAESKFRELLQVAETRRALFNETSAEYEAPCRDFGEYFKLTGTKLPVVTLVIEELIVLMQLVKPDLLVRLLVLGRSAGVFVLALAQYLKADILDRKASINFNSRIFLGKYDRIACGILFGDLDKQETGLIADWLGEPGKCVFDDQGDIDLLTMPRVEDYHLSPFFKKGQ
jgi:hypothetical protein